jgi:hypothetical protein
MAPGARSPDARLGLFGAARATPAPSEEDEGGLTSASPSSSRT